MHEQLLDVFPLVSRSGGLGGDPSGRPPVFKAVGISLAVASGLFIGVSFVLKKVGLLRANLKYNEEAGEGYGYLKNFYWWAGMILMILGEICNFVAYAFVDAILVTPLGALSVVVTTVLSAIFLKERLSFVGKVGCFNCIIGSVVIAMNAPQQSSVSNIQDMKRYALRPVFLSYAGVIIVACTFLAIWAGPRYGKKSMFVYLSICSLIGGLSVVATQGLGAAIIAQISGQSQFKEWFLYVLLGFVISTLLTEIIYLNKALNLFNAALVTPTYYVIFTSATIITSAVLFQGFKGSPISITTVVMGFLQICTGVVLLQLSKSAKDVPDAAIFKGDLDQVRVVAEQEQPELEPKADAIRGAAAIIRRLSTPRQRMEKEEIMRYRHERRLDELEPPGENEVIEWDGIRRRRTVLSQRSGTTVGRNFTPHPPLGMSRFPDYDEEVPVSRPATGTSFFGSFRHRASSARQSQRSPSDVSQGAETQVCSVELDSVSDRLGKERNDNHKYTGIKNYPGDTLSVPQQDHLLARKRGSTLGSVRFADEVKYDDENPSGQGRDGPPTPPAHSTRQFSFQKLFHREPSSSSPANSSESLPRREHSFLKLSNFVPHRPPSRPKRTLQSTTEEEALGLVKSESLKPQRTNDTSRTPSPTSSILESMNDKTPGADTPFFSSRSHRSSSTSSSSSSNHFRQSNRVSSYDIGDDKDYDVAYRDSNSRNQHNTRSLTAHTPQQPSPLSAPSLQGRNLPPLPSEASHPQSAPLPTPTQQNPNMFIPPLPPDSRSIPSAPPSVSSADFDSAEERLEDESGQQTNPNDRGPVSFSSSRHGNAFI